MRAKCSRLGLWAAALILGAACGSETRRPAPTVSSCVPGATRACVCVGGGTGAQRCEDDGRYAPCVCAAPADGGSTAMDAGAADAASASDAAAEDAAPPAEDAAVDAGPSCADECTMGEAASCSGADRVGCGDFDPDPCLERGVLETCAGACFGGACVECVATEDCADPVRERCDSSSRTCVPAPEWADVEVRYDGSAAVRQLDNCYFCDATLTSGAHPLLLRYQQGGGYIVWSIYLAQAADRPGTYPVGGTTSGLSYVFISESGSSVPSHLQGGYFSTAGSITLSEADIRSGGRVAGTLSVQLEGPNGGTTPASITGAFFAEIP